jgi:chorismate-pyruvate lyase
MHRLKSHRWRTFAALNAKARRQANAHCDLTDPGSLTARLVARHGASFYVEVLRERYARPSADEGELLGLAPGACAWIREVALWGDGVIQVQARSVLPLSTLTGRLRRLKGLNNRPLGGAIFADPRLKRVRMEFAIGAICARRSLFVIGPHRLLVQEAFW